MKHALIALMIGGALVGGTLFTQEMLAQDKTKEKAPAKAPAKAADGPAKAANSMDLLKPATVTGKPPKVFVARLETTKGNVDIRVTTAWSPIGAERFYNLVRAGFYDNIYFFRVVPGFMAQFGINSNPAVTKAWSGRSILDDRVVDSNKRGRVTFAKTGEPNSRTTQLFINYGNNAGLDSQGFSPFGEVIAGMEFVDMIYSGYGEQPDQGQITGQGEAYLNRNFPRLDKVVKATILEVVEK